MTEVELNRLYRSCALTNTMIAAEVDGMRSGAAFRCSRGLYPWDGRWSEDMYCRLWLIDGQLCGGEFRSRPELLEFALAAARRIVAREDYLHIHVRGNEYVVRVGRYEEYSWSQQRSKELLGKLVEMGVIEGVPPTVPVVVERSMDLGAIGERATEGMLIGGAVGDALGYPVESMTYEERSKHYGYIRKFIANRRTRGAVGVVSDDTQMSFDTLIVLLANGFVDMEDLASTFSSHKMFGIGGTVKEFLRRYKDGGATWYRSSIESGGNGAVMRIHPLLIAHASGINDGVRGLYADLVLDTVMTHRGALAVSLSVAFASLLARLASGGRVDPHEELSVFGEIVRAVGGRVRAEVHRKVPFDEGNDVADYVANAVTWGLESGVSVEEFASLNAVGSSGYLLETVPTALFIIFRHIDEPLRAVLEAANKTYDNDTVASLVGTAMGARHGVRPFAELADGLCGCIREDDVGTIGRLTTMATEFVRDRARG